MTKKGDEWGKIGDGGGYMVVTCERILYLVNQFEKKKKRRMYKNFICNPRQSIYIFDFYIFLFFNIILLSQFLFLMLTFHHFIYSFVNTMQPILCCHRLILNFCQFLQRISPISSLITMYYTQCTC